MCNTYVVRPKKGAIALGEAVSESILKLKSQMVRRTGPGVVVSSLSGKLSPQIMRWGFEHPKYREVNNARSSSLKSPFWAESFRDRRCIVPVSKFFEWQEPPATGQPKQCYEFRSPDEEWMWVAGIYQPSDTHGNCYATITTDPPEWMVPIHDRMLAVLTFEDALAFLDGTSPPFAPYSGRILAAPSESPLRRKPPTPGTGTQGELF
jgi:putative SOS response-associated peptidase YedK